MGFAITTILIIFLISVIQAQKYEKMEKEVLRELGLPNWNSVPYIDEVVIVKSRQALENYNDIKFFKENSDKLAQAEIIIKRKGDTAKTLRAFLNRNDFQKRYRYAQIAKQVGSVLANASAYRISVNYISSAGNHLGQKVIALRQDDIERFKKNPHLLMSKSEYNKYLKEQQKEVLEHKQHEYYNSVNEIIDYANKSKNDLVIKGGQEELDNLIAQLFDRTVNSIKKVKTVDSEEWRVIGDFIARIKVEIKKLIDKNEKILAYYDSDDFAKIKDTCAALISSQREFNEYIAKKVKSISQLFGTRIVRSQTVNSDEYNYIRPYKKSITSFTAEVSSSVFASAENNPLGYVVKNFYPNKSMYPEQIQKLQQLIEELETLREAKQIIDNYKQEYQQYLEEVPEYILSEDESGFYSRLGFATIDDSTLTVEYKFVYTSNGGMAQRSFTVPMTEETIVDLVRLLESKLTASALAKEQRNLMTKKLREHIKIRDNFTCCNCGNSSHAEPNLLLEIDHIIPISKGGITTEDNLQTLCWKCNRSKSNKIV